MRAGERDGSDTSRDTIADDIAVLILTHNEEANIGRTLDALRSFAEVIVLDSHSTDRTIEIASGYPNVRVAQNVFSGHAAQWTFGLTRCGLVKTWVLALDADYVLPASLVEEIRAIRKDASCVGYRAAFRYLVHGRPLSASLYPPVVVLFRRELGAYRQEGHTQRLVIEGTIGTLAARIEHDDRKPLARWFESQLRYAKLEAERVTTEPSDRLRRVDRLRRLVWVMPPAALVYTLFAKGCIFDGRRGWLYAMQRTLAEILIAIEVLDRKLQSGR